MDRSTKSTGAEYAMVAMALATLTQFDPNLGMGPLAEFRASSLAQLGTLHVDDEAQQRAVVGLLREEGVAHSGELQVPLADQCDAHLRVLIAEAVRDDGPPTPDSVATRLTSAHVGAAAAGIRRNGAWNAEIESAWHDGAGRHPGLARRSGFCGLDSLAMGIVQARAGTETLDADAADRLTVQLHFDMVRARVPREDGAPPAATVRHQGGPTCAPRWIPATDTDEAISPWMREDDVARIAARHNVRVVLFTQGGFTVFDPDHPPARGSSEHPVTTVFMAHTDDNNHFAPVSMRSPTGPGEAEVEPEPEVTAATDAESRRLLEAERDLRRGFGEPERDASSAGADDCTALLAADPALDAAELQWLEAAEEALSVSAAAHTDDPARPRNPVQGTRTAAQAGHVVVGMVGPGVLWDTDRLRRLTSNMTCAIQAERLVSQHGEFFDGAPGRLNLGGKASEGGAQLRVDSRSGRRTCSTVPGWASRW